MLTQARLHELLNYDPDTGVFTWKKRTSNRSPVGSIAGTLSNGYWGITVAGVRTYAHRLAFLYMEGDFPLAQVIDHIDGNKLNNKWVNLRRFSHNLNNTVGRLRSDNKTGVNGVYYNSNCGKNPWLAYIAMGGKRKYLGYFSTKEEAVEARTKAEKEIWPV